MYEADPTGGADALLARLDSVLDEFTTLDLTGHTDDQLIEILTGLEQRVRRFATVDHALIAETETRGVAIQHGCSNTTAFLARLLRIGVGQARLRVRAARELAPRRTLLGEVLQAEFPATAAAQADGAISPEHARVITSTIHALPADVREESFEQIESELAGYARQITLDQFRLLARHLGDVLDPDGTLKDAKYRDRQRGLSVRQRPDGSVTGSFEGTAEFGETLLTLLDKTAAPRPETDGTKDPRTPAQRRHDGLLDAMTTLLRSERLGDCNGVTTTIIYTMTADQAHTGTGLARTGHGALVPVQDVLANIGDARLFPVILDDEPATGPPDQRPPDKRLFGRVKPVAGYGSTHRIYTEGQRLAMIARDQGCSFPGCTAGPQWCQAHHVTEWRIGKRTCIDDSALLCGFHHREFEKLGWACQLINGIPNFVAPYWLDGDRTPRRNTAHDVPAA
jgi:hypothetical protein